MYYRQTFGNISAISTSPTSYSYTTGPNTVQPGAAAMDTTAVAIIVKWVLTIFVVRPWDWIHFLAFENGRVENLEKKIMVLATF